MPLTDNPFGYGNLIPTGRPELQTANLELTKWSADALRFGSDQLLFSRFVQTGVDFGVGVGGTIRVPVLAWDRTISGTAPLTQGSSIPVGTTDLDYVDVNVNEFGRAYSKTAFFDYLTNMNYRNQLVMQLGFNFGVTWDAYIRDQFMGGVHGAYSNAAANSGLNIGSALSDEFGTQALNGSHIEQLRDHLKAQFVPTFPNGLYAMIGNAQTFRNIKQEQGWTNLQLYNLRGENIIRQSVGVFNGVAFFETEENTENHKSVIFGPGAVVQGFGSPMEIRVEGDWKQDFQRFMAFAWYLIGGAAPALRDKGTHAMVIRTGAST